MKSSKEGGEAMKKEELLSGLYEYLGQSENPDLNYWKQRGRVLMNCVVDALWWRKENLGEDFSFEDIKKHLDFDKVLFLSVLYTVGAKRFPEAEVIKNNFYNYLKVLSEDMPSLIKQMADAYERLYGDRIDLPYNTLFSRWQSLEKPSFNKEVIHQHTYAQQQWVRI